MDVFLGTISILAFLVCLVWLLVNLIRRKDKRRPLMGLGISFLLLIVALLIAPNTEKAEAQLAEAIIAIEQGDFAKGRELALVASKTFGEENNKATVLILKLDESESETHALEVLTQMTNEEVALLKQGNLKKEFYTIKSLNDRFLATLIKTLPMREAKLKEIKKEQEALAKAKRQEKIDAQFSAWDGAHRNLVEAVKKVMHNPKSFKHVETVYWDMRDHLVVRMTFRGTNQFGAVITSIVKAWIDLDGNLQKWEWL